MEVSAALAEAARQAQEQDRAARRRTVDKERAERLAQQILAGDGPPPARVLAAEVAAALRAGVSVDACRRLLDASREAGATEHAAVLSAALRASQEATEGRAVSRLPDMPVDDLLAEAPIARAAVYSVARRALAPADLPAMAFLAACSGALAAKAIGLTRNNDGSMYEVRPHLFVAAEAPSGAAKSLIADTMVRRPLGPVWDAVARSMEQAAARDEEERERATRARDRLRKSDPESPEIEQHTLRLRQPRVQEPVVLEVGTATPEQWTRQLQWSGFSMIAADEGADWLGKFVGARDQDAKLGPLLCAWGGDEFAYRSIAGEQRGDSRPMFRRLHAAALFLLQPGVLSPTSKDEQARLKALHSRGLLPRTMIARPRALTVAERRAVERDVRDNPDGGEPVARYHAVLQALARAPLPPGRHPLQPLVEVDGAMKPAPIVIKFTAEATAERRAYQVRCGDEVAEDGPARGQADERSVARLHDHAARVAICLAAWRQAERDHAAGRPVQLAEAVVGVEDVRRAVRLCEDYLRPHGAAAAGRSILDPLGDDAEQVVAAMKKRGRASMRQRDVQRALGRGWDAGRVRRAVAELEERGEVVVEPGSKGSATVALASP